MVVSQVTKRGFDGSSGVVKSFEALRRELFFGRFVTRHSKRTVGQLQLLTTRNERVYSQ